MIGRRASDIVSPGFRYFLVLLAACAVTAAAFTWLPADEVVTPKPIDACRDNIAQSSDGKDWHPVYIKKTKRTIPCVDEVVK